ncbi:MAG TPA: MFS transporter [Acetobacteraceae bacterium]
MTGIGTAVWAPLVPDAKLRLGLDESTLGLVLLALGGGAIATMPAAGWLVARIGARAVILSLGLAFCLAMPALAVAPSPSLLVLALGIFGAALGGTDIAMNAQAVMVEKAAGRPMMSGFHGAFSLGGLTGAGAMSLLRGAGLSPLVCATLVAASCFVLLAWQARALLPRGSEDAAGASFALPHGRLAVIGMLCFVAFLIEGVVLDWSAVFLRFVRGADAAAAGLGYAAFSLTATVGRLTGDMVVRRLRPLPVLRWGALFAAGGFAVIAMVPGVYATLLGCALVGLGAANVVPVLFGAAGRLPGMAPGLAISAAATPGYAGLLAGPAIVGLAGEAMGLPLAFLGIGLLTLAVAAGARLALRTG